MNEPIRLNVVEVSTPLAFDYALYPQQHPGTYTYLQNQFSNISSTIMDSGKQFLEAGREMMEKFCDGTLEKAARATLRMARNLMNPNAIQRYNNLEDIQAASPLMQRYIMSDPYIREKFHHQQCSGFSDSYIDNDPSFLREKHYDWRRVNNGMVRFEGEGENEEWVSTTYLEDLRENDRELSFEEKVDILSTCELAKLFMQDGFDSTDPFGGKL